MIKSDLTNKIEELEKKKTKLLSTNDNYQEYLSQGGEIMSDIANRYIIATPNWQKTNHWFDLGRKADFLREQISN